MATCSSCGKVCIIQQERSFTTAADSCDVQLTLDDLQTPSVLSGALVVDDDPTNLLVPGTCGWSVPEAAVISVIDANICTILSDQSINCFGDVDTTTTPPTSGQFMAWNGTQWVPATLPAGTAVNVEDANGNFTVLNGNGNIPLDSTGNVGYVTGGKLRIPGAKLEVSSVYTTPFSQNVTNPTGFTDSANLISTSITNTTTKDRLYYLSLYGIEFATSCLQGQVGHTLKVTGAVTYTLVSATKGNSGVAGNCDNSQTLYQPLVLTPGQSINVNCAYRWQNAAAGAPTLTFNGARLELTVTSHGMEN